MIFKKIFFALAFVLTLCLALTGCSNSEVKKNAVTEQRFDDVQFWGKMFEKPEREKWQKPVEVVETLNLGDGDVVADIGAGTGYFTRHLARAVSPVGIAIGLDISQSMVNYMKEDALKHNLKNYEARLVNTDDPGLSENSVDLIFLCNTYHHIANRIDYFRRISGALKAGGRVVIVDFYDKPMPVGPQAPGHKLAKSKVIGEMKKAGYRLRKSHNILNYQYFLEFGL